MQGPPMKLSISRDNLLSGLQMVGRAVSSRATLPAPGGVEFTAAGQTLTLRATDMEMGLTVSLSEVQIETEGTVLLPGRLPGPDQEGVILPAPPLAETNALVLHAALPISVASRVAHLTLAVCPGATV